MESHFSHSFRLNNCAETGNKNKSCPGDTLTDRWLDKFLPSTQQWVLSLFVLGCLTALKGVLGRKHLSLIAKLHIYIYFFRSR